MNTHQLAKKYGLLLVVKFGSRAKGNHRSNSDIDIAYLAEPSLSLEDETKLSTDLAEILRGKIDLADIRQASPLLRYHIFRYGQSIYERQTGLFAEHFTRSLRIYEETLPLYKLKLAQL